MAKKVLLVDDDPAVRESLSQSLAAEGFEVRAVCSPGEALESWGGILPEVIVLDSGVSSGGLTATDLAKWIHRSIQMPIVFFTGKVTPELQGLAADLRVVIVPKPNIELLIETVKKAELG